MPHQLPLPFQHQPRYHARDFIPACSNREALAWLDADWPEQRLVLFGPEGCGKSHVLQIWAARANATLLSGATLTDLDSLPQRGALALDDADSVGDETLLFHLLNTARDRGLQLLLASRSAPSRWPVRLPDLSSRLRAMSAVQIGPPDDELLAALLKRLIADRQLVMTRAAQDWVLHHLPRSPATIREAVARLDRESLASGVAITRSLAVTVLKEDGLAVAKADDVSMSEGDPSSRARDIL
jgi:chromosomal replication initiation ATPase DnaA